MTPVEACAARGGAASWAQLRALGVTRAALARAVDARAVFRVARGVYALPASPRIVHLEAAWRAQRTCITALRAWGLPAPSVDSKAHVAIPHSRSLTASQRRSLEVRLHWVRGPVAHAGTVLGALDCASMCLSAQDQLAAVDAALNGGLLTVADLDHLLITPPSRAQWLRDSCDPSCQSPLETFARVALREAGLPVATQVHLPGVGRVDFVVDDAVVVEVDGSTYHMNERSFWDDRRRDRVTQVGGRLALRFTRQDVERDLAGLVDTVTRGVELERMRRGLGPLTRITIRRWHPWVAWRGMPTGRIN
ncbi:type IV toxin-antitoxin system AbiEi family antitoxin domain-containing protein [Demequina sp. SO4-13]|uniref:type IV toxin-antitoxin system AbiEi family antitoxin domain-containing protein n=1 Tax=Demequina sp. SO4-13 TaxID=3401027 RepID=UPI003AF934F3